jgi:hypothetical protein
VAAYGFPSFILNSKWRRLTHRGPSRRRLRDTLNLRRRRSATKTTFSVDVDVPANANGVIYALGGFSGGLALCVKDGVLSYEYNLFEIQRTHIKAKDKLPTGKAKIEVETTYIDPKPTGPLKVVLRVNGEEVASGEVPVSAPLTFTANDALDFGIDLGSPVGIEYYDQAPFKFNGTIEGATVKYLGSEAELKKEELKTERPIPMAD